MHDPPHPGPHSTAIRKPALPLPGLIKPEAHQAEVAREIAHDAAYCDFSKAREPRIGRDSLCLRGRPAASLPRRIGGRLVDEVVYVATLVVVAGEDDALASHPSTWLDSARRLAEYALKDAPRGSVREVVLLSDTVGK